MTSDIPIIFILRCLRESLVFFRQKNLYLKESICVMLQNDCGMLISLGNSKQSSDNGGEFEAHVLMLPNTNIIMLMLHLALDSP